MGKITLSVEMSGNTLSFEAETNDIDTTRLVSYYGRRYGLVDTSAILEKWFENIVLASKADVVEAEKLEAAKTAVEAVQDIVVSFR